MIVEVPSSTLSIIHIFDGEEVVIAGEDGLVWVATFASPAVATVFVQLLKLFSSTVKGERGKR